MAGVGAGGGAEDDDVGEAVLADVMAEAGAGRAVGLEGDNAAGGADEAGEGDGVGADVGADVAGDEAGADPAAEEAHHVGIAFAEDGDGEGREVVLHRDVAVAVGVGEAEGAAGPDAPGDVMEPASGVDEGVGEVEVEPSAPAATGIICQGKGGGAHAVDGEAARGARARSSGRGAGAGEFTRASQSRGYGGRAWEAAWLAAVLGAGEDGRALGGTRTAQARILPSAKTGLPATMVWRTRPRSFWPCQGELADLEKPFFAS